MLLVRPLHASDRIDDPQVEYANMHKSGDAGYRQGWFGQGETRLHYVTVGNGPLVILYHGFPSNWFVWFDMMEALKGRYRVVAVDGLGAGLSGKPARLEPYRIDRLGKQLDGLARHLNGKRRFILVGHDWGAALGFAYAQAYPERLHAVAGMSAPPYNLFLGLLRDNEAQRKQSVYMQQFRMTSLDRIRENGFAPRFAGQVFGGLRDGGHLSARQAELLAASVGRPEAMDGGMNWYRANIPMFDQIKSARRWPAHDRPIAAPTLLIWGEKDTTFVPEFLDAMPQVAPKLSVVKLPGVGHMTPIDQSALSAKAVGDFIDRACLQTAKRHC
jgi:epoxide hydrolase 4